MKAEATFSLTGKSYLYYDLGANFFDTANVYSFGIQRIDACRTQVGKLGRAHPGAVCGRLD